MAADEQADGAAASDAAGRLSSAVLANCGCASTAASTQPPDTEPAIAFHPTRAKKELYAPKAKFRFGKVEAPQFKNIEELAFAPR